MTITATTKRRIALARICPQAYICFMAPLPFPQSRCAHCLHLRTTENKRGSVFMLCDRNRTEPAFPKYPPQPVHACGGFESAE